MSPRCEIIFFNILVYVGSFPYGYYMLNLVKIVQLLCNFPLVKTCQFCLVFRQQERQNRSRYENNQMHKSKHMSMLPKNDNDMINKTINQWGFGSSLNSSSRHKPITKEVSEGKTVTSCMSGNSVTSDLQPPGNHIKCTSLVARAVYASSVCTYIFMLCIRIFLRGV